MTDIDFYHSNHTDNCLSNSEMALLLWYNAIFSEGQIKTGFVNCPKWDSPKAFHTISNYLPKILEEIGKVKYPFLRILFTQTLTQSLVGSRSQHRFKAQISMLRNVTTFVDLNARDKFHRMRRQLSTSSSSILISRRAYLGK